MSHSVIEDVAAATATLRSAMHSADPAEIEKAIAGFHSSLEMLTTVESWEKDPAIKARLSEILADLDSSRMLACLLDDVTAQKQAVLARRDFDAPQPLYKPAR